jgi:hypothetical protein
MDTQVWIVIIALMGGVIIFLGALLYTQKHRSEELRDRFGPEYDRTLRERGSQKQAEDELEARERRVTRLKIVPLSPADAARFSEAWRGVQNRFVDNPRGAVAEADRQVTELMNRRGYPTGDFEQRAADLSVSHAAVIEHYREAHVIARRAETDGADTETLRRAIVHYRAIFDELLEVQQNEPRVQSTERKETSSWKAKIGRDIFRRPI